MLTQKTPYKSSSTQRGLKSFAITACHIVPCVVVKISSKSKKQHYYFGWDSCIYFKSLMCDVVIKTPSGSPTTASQNFVKRVPMPLPWTDLKISLVSPPVQNKACESKFGWD